HGGCPLLPQAKVLGSLAFELGAVPPDAAAAGPPGAAGLPGDGARALVIGAFAGRARGSAAAPWALPLAAPPAAPPDPAAAVVAVSCAATLALGGAEADPAPKTPPPALPSGLEHPASSKEPSTTHRKRVLMAGLPRR